MIIDANDLNIAAEALIAALASAKSGAGLRIAPPQITTNQARKAILGALTILSGHVCRPSDEMELTRFQPPA